MDANGSNFVAHPDPTFNLKAICPEEANNSDADMSGNAMDAVLSDFVASSPQIAAHLGMALGLPGLPLHWNLMLVSYGNCL
jgi:hypothetical protein